MARKIHDTLAQAFTGILAQVGAANQVLTDDVEATGAHLDLIVELIYDRDQVCLRVKDNGQGFGVGSIPASEGFGLLGMSERAERIGAQLTIRSQPGQGTEMIVTVNRE